MLSPLTTQVNKSNINHFKQNKIKYIIRDFRELGIDETTTRTILLSRGVNKWLANRKDIIALKNDCRKKINDKHQELKLAKARKHYYHIAKLKGEIKALNEILTELHRICHRSRWQFPE